MFATLVTISYGPTAHLGAGQWFDEPEEVVFHRGWDVALCAAVGACPVKLPKKIRAILVTMERHQLEICNRVWRGSLDKGDSTLAWDAFHNAIELARAYDALQLRLDTDRDGMETRERKRLQVCLTAFALTISAYTRSYER